MTLTAAAVATTDGLPWQAQVALAALSTIGICAGAWQATKASRHSRRAADAATDVANRTITNHGQTIGEHIEALGDKWEDLSGRVDQGHRILDQIADQLVSVRADLDKHLAQPHTKPRTRKSLPGDGPTDLDEVAEKVARKRTPRKRTA